MHHWKIWCHAKLTGIEGQQLSGLAGQLNWIFSHTKPDISYQAYDVSTPVQCKTIDDLKNTNTSMQKLRYSKVTLSLPDLGDPGNSHIVCFSDAAFGNLKCGALQVAFILLFMWQKDFPYKKH